MNDINVNDVKDGNILTQLSIKKISDSHIRTQLSYSNILTQLSI